MARTKQTAQQGVGGGKKLVTFPPNTDRVNDDSSDNSTGSHSKAAMMAKQLPTKAVKTADVRKRVQNIINLQQLLETMKGRSGDINQGLFH